MPNLSKIKLIKELYYDKNLSTVQIAKSLNTTPWAVLSFMRRNDMPRRTFKEANRLWFDKKPLSFSFKEKLSIQDNRLKLAGIMLYWAEGSKGGKNNTVDFCNSNPEMIKVFLKFLRNICNIDEKRLRVLIYCHSNQDIDVLLNYWYKLTKIPLNQFVKPYVRHDYNESKKDKMKYGVVHIRYSDKKLLLKLKDWVKDYLKKE
jgi:hypothetical protein